MNDLANHRTERVTFAPGSADLQRAEVFLRRTSFEPHRHDSYALGITVAGVQTFRYLDEARVCVPTQLHLLHPDELHDGTPGVPGVGFSYRIAYISPAAIQRVHGSYRLPFVREPVHSCTGPAAPLAHALRGILYDLHDLLDPLRTVDMTVAVADGLWALADSAAPRQEHSFDLVAVQRAWEFLTDDPVAPTTAETLEEVSGIDRYSLTRQFKSAYGTSPGRYRLLRRLDLARNALTVGAPISSVAQQAGFADQSHLTRHFKRAFGITPGRWRQLSSLNHPK